MNFRPRHLLIRWFLPVTWKWNVRQKVRVLQEFAQTELDSAWQSLFALNRVTDPRTRALLFAHAFEELHHSDLFARLANKKAPVLPSQPLTRRSPLMPLDRDDTRDAVEFFAFLSIGESEIRTDFNVYEKAFASDPETRDLFRAISADEEHHAESSGHELYSLAKDHGLSLGWIRLRHLGALAYKRYVSLMGKFGSLPMTVFLFVAYALFGPMFAGQAKKRLKLHAGDQLGLLKLQQSAIDDSLRKAR